MEKQVIIEEFAIKQFNEKVMRNLLPLSVFKKWQQAVCNETQIDRETADAIAHAMKIWAIDLGATHFCHWFQPMTGLTAEKHESFVQMDSEGQPIVRLSGKSLLKGETDGSSFPNGGLRTAFEARGHTYLDITSYAFVRGHVLFIPCVFVSYTGAKLDHKLPLLAALEKMNANASKVLRKLGYQNFKSVKAMIGLEQEYFLVDKEQALKRPDIVFTGKTLMGESMPKDQGMNDHYFGALTERVSSFMKEVNQKCWEVGIYASTEHNEVAPGQYEFVSIFTNVNLAVDQNMVVMDILKRIALRHDLICLLNEKPFDGVNGSGKHNNFSLCTDSGMNLFELGEDASSNLRFMLFASAFIQTVDRYATLIRMSCSDAGNDYRLGGHEAPPAIVSIFLGDHLHHVFEDLATKADLSHVELEKMYSPIQNLSALPLDITDRNRTSPVSFTGNKFEIRILGSSRSASALNATLLAGIAEALGEIEKKLEGCEPENIQKRIVEIVHDILVKHHRVLFAGDGYSKEWTEEAKQRGLDNFPNYIDSVETLKEPHVRRMLSSLGVLSEEEIDARYDIYYNEFNQTVIIQAKTLISMVDKGIIPALVKTLTLYKGADIATTHCVEALKKKTALFGALIDDLYKNNELLHDSVMSAIQCRDKKKAATILVNKVRPLLQVIKTLCNNAEHNIPKEYYPYPTLQDLIV
ncbi:MAG: glutamine synthetase III [Bacilli bacterium]|nr:glutamine synthetase III [Bacilli bacterium]